MTNPFILSITCSICHKPVKLETTTTDEQGKAIHEECYVQAVAGTHRQASQTLFTRVLSVMAFSNHRHTATISQDVAAV